MWKTNNGVSGARRRERAKEESGVPAPEDGAGEEDHFADGQNQEGELNTLGPNANTEAKTVQFRLIVSLFIELIGDQPGQMQDPFKTDVIIDGQILLLFAEDQLKQARRPYPAPLCAQYICSNDCCRHP